MSLYDTLGVPKDAGVDDIKRAYKKKAVEHHPDKGGDEEEFKTLSHAYSVLSDPVKRQRYDQLGDRYEDGDGGGNGHPFAAGFDPNQIFAELFADHPFFGRQQQQQQQRRNHVHKIRISLKEAYTGLVKQINANLQKPCFACVKACGMCQGRGQVNDMIRMGFMTQIMTRACERCEGKGKIPAGQPGCAFCGGAGQKQEQHTITLKIPPGAPAGHHIRFEGLGEQPTQPGEHPGDLIFEIHVADDSFRRTGNDLQTDLSIDLADSIVGREFAIDHFGEAVRIDTAKLGIIQPGKRYVIEGKGMPVLERPGTFGNLILVFAIQYPAKKMSERDREHLRAAFKWST